MCLAFGVINDDVIYGYNLDIDPEVWNYSLIMNKNYFGIGIKIGSTTYLSHGVNKEGIFANLPYMNGEERMIPKGVKRERLDLLVDRLLRGKYSFSDLEEIIENKTIVTIPKLSLHSLIGNSKGEMYLIEPGYSIEKKENKALITNFPLLTTLSDYSNPFYGKDRYDIGISYLNECNNFTYMNGLELLNKTKQTGQWGTRVSFVYSRNDNTVYYVLDGNFDDVKVHHFK